LDPAITPKSADEHASHVSERASGPHGLPQVLDLTEARSLRDDMMALLRSGAIMLDAGAVERMSTPCAQVLLAAGQAAEAANCQFQIVNASDCFQAAVVDLGLQSQFTNWMV
jgi:chemotaxis protein CheX